MWLVAPLALVLAIIPTAVISTDRISIAPNHLGRRQTSSIPNSTNRRRALHSIAVLNNRLYIEGGEVSRYVNGIREPGAFDSIPVTDTVSLPLDAAWTNTTVELVVIPHTKPTLKYFGLWSDPQGNSIYSWGGKGTNDPSKDLAGARNKTVWGFTPSSSQSDGTTGAWRPVEPANPATFDVIRRGTQGVAAVCGRTGYYLGGFAGPYSDEDVTPGDTATPGLLAYNMATSTWANTTAPERFATMKLGEGLCAPFGGAGGEGDGLVIWFGGKYDDLNTAREMHMSEIGVYDPGTGRWYTQTATGEIPSDRARFCAAAAAGPNGTWEVVMYGGVNVKVLGDVYVLSLPAFVWFKAPASAAGPLRHVHRCVTAGKGGRQMISVGGFGSGIDDWRTDNTDQWSQGIGVFDMSSLTWQDGYDPDAPGYESPEMVSQFYANGGLDKVAWSSDEIKALFVNGASLPETSPEDNTRNDNSASSPDTSTTTRDSNTGTPTGAIVGVVLGGLALAALIAIGFLWRKRRQNRRLAAAAEEPKSYMSQQPSSYMQQQYPGHVSEMAPNPSRVELESEYPRTAGHKHWQPVYEVAG